MYLQSLGSNLLFNSRFCLVLHLDEEDLDILQSLARDGVVPDCLVQLLAVVCKVIGLHIRQLTIPVRTSKGIDGGQLGEPLHRGEFGVAELGLLCRGEGELVGGFEEGPDEVRRDRDVWAAKLGHGHDFGGGEVAVLFSGEASILVYFFFVKFCCVVVFVDGR